MELDDEELKATKNREKTADEMFEELGFVKFEDEINIKYFCGGHEIWFYKRIKEIESCCGIGSEYINLQELQAINKKVEELGWKKIK